MDPLYFGHVWIYDCNKIEPSWDALVLLLKEKVLYLSSSVSFTNFKKLSINAR